MESTNLRLRCSKFCRSRTVLPLSLFQLEDRTVPSFAAAVDMALTSTAQGIVAADLNRDGITDLVVTQQESNSVEVLIGNGSGQFTVGGTFGTGQNPYRLAVADLNSDGKLDLVVANYDDKSVSVLLGNGDGTLATKVSYTSSALAPNAKTSAVAIGDFNRDGHPDVLVSFLNDNRVLFFSGSATGTLGVPQELQVGTNPNSFGIADFNRDGKLDFVVANAFSGNVSVMLGNADGTFATAPPYGDLGLGAAYVTSGDFNRDGKSDLAIVGNTIAGSIYLGFGNGDGTFQAPVAISKDLGKYSIQAGDFNADGLLDLAVATISAGIGGITIYHGDGNGGFLAAGSYPVGPSGGPPDFVPSDFNRDGKVDLAVPNPGSKSFSLLVNTSPSAMSGTFRNGPTNTVSVTNPFGIVTADFNRDGRADFVTIGKGISDNLSFYAGLGNGQFADPVTTSAFANLDAITVGDVNRDGKLDLVTTNGVVGSTSLIRLLLGNGDGSFQPGVTLANPTYTTHLTIGDLNRDGTPDIVAATNGHLLIMLNQGDGTFQHHLYDVEPGPGPLLLGDLNGDGNIDLIYTNDSGVFVRFGVGDGALSPAVSLLPSDEVLSLAIGDLNRDGVMDVAIGYGTQNNGRVGIIVGNHLGIFPPVSETPTGTYPLALVMTDFDNDGRLDVAVTNSASSTITVLKGAGDGTFLNVTDYPTIGNGQGLVSSDFNRDGRPDLGFVTIGSSYAINTLLGNPAVHSPLLVTTDADTMDGGTLADPLGPDGLLSLREAITVANLNTGPDIITFNIPGGGLRTIELGASLPTITEDLTIDGFTQPGASASTLPVGDNAVRLIMVDGNTKGRLFTVDDGTTAGSINVTLRGMKLTGGNVEGVGVQGSGGAVFNQNEYLSLDGMEFTLNSAWLGGALAAAGGKTTVVLSQFEGNFAATRGGAVYLMNGEWQIKHSIVRNNSSAEAGAFFHEAGGLILDGVTVEGNTTKVPGTSGGAYLLYGGSMAWILNSTFVNNGAPISSGGQPTWFTTYGGAIRMAYNSTVFIDNSTFSNNSARVAGGAIYTDSSGPLVMQHVTITDNHIADTAVGEGGGLWSSTQGPSRLYNTIVAGNHSVNGTDLFGTVEGRGSLVGIGDGMVGLQDGVNLNQVGTADTPINAKLAPLANNGGWTGTHLFLPLSPAIDRGEAGGSGLTSDQRGLSRIVNGLPDIGAVEVRLPTISSIADQTVSAVDGPYSWPFTPASPDTLDTVWGYTATGGTDLGNFVVIRTGMQFVLRFEPFTTANGSRLVTLNFHDGSGRTASTTFLLTVTNPSLVVTTDSDTLDGGTLADPLGPDGLLSLREAITIANLNPGRDTIAFDIPGAGVHTIEVGSSGLGALPAITDPVTIEGYSQSDSSPNTLSVGDNAQIRIALLGNNLAPLSNGLTIRSGATDSVIRGLSIGGFPQYGISIEDGVTGVRVVGNFIGTDATGMVSRGNRIGGVYVLSAHHIIGGADPADRNIISSNGIDSPYGVGIYFFSPEAFDNRVFGNYVGPAADGITGLGNVGYGIVVDGSGAFGNYLGGVNPGEGNVISWNGVDTFGGGILLLDTSGNLVRGNLIGTTASGLGRLGNDGVGVRVLFGSGNTIGGDTPAARNVIADTAGDGIQLQFTSGNTVQGNYLGTNVSGFTDISGPGPNSFGNGGHGLAIYGSNDNLIRNNLISGNKDDGIRFGTFNNDGQILGSNNNTLQGNWIGTTADGTAGMGNGRDGIFVSNSSSNTIGGTTPDARNVISGNGNNAIGISGGTITPDGNIIQGNYIGTNAAGTAKIGNRSVGIAVSGATNTFIGGSSAGAGNVISGNITGIALGGTGSVAGTIVQGNLIGTNASGTAALSNYVGIGIANSSGNTIGGTVTGAGNVISGNSLAGVVLVSSGPATTGNQLLGNTIGTALDQLTPIGNGGADPVVLTPILNQSLQAFDPTLPALTSQQVAELDGGVVVWGASDNTIGGTATGEGNIIANTRKAIGSYPSSGNGVTIDTGNGNRISGNQIYGNEGLGIDLVNNGNSGQPAPVIASVMKDDDSTTFSGTLTANPSKTYTLEFFASPSEQQFQGRFYLGSGTVTTAPNGVGSFTISVPISPGTGVNFNATATSGANDSSEFSAAIVLPPPVSPPPVSPPPVSPPPPVIPPIPQPQPYAIGSAAGITATLRLLDAHGADRIPPITPFGLDFTGGVRVASGDVTGDGIHDVLAASGPGMVVTVRVFDGVTGDAVTTITPFEPSFTGGAYVTVGDLNGDGLAETVISPDYGGGPRVQVLDGRSGAVIVDFFAFEENFRGGVTTAIGDIDGDGQPDLVVGAGTGGGPRVAVFGGASVLAANPTRIRSDFFAFEPESRVGVHLATGDLNGDGKSDVVISAGIDGGPRVLIVSGESLFNQAGTLMLLANFFADPEPYRGGVHVTTRDVDGDSHPELLVGSGDHSGGLVQVFGADRILTVSNPVADLAFNPIPDFNGGIFVG